MSTRRLGVEILLARGLFVKALGHTNPITFTTGAFELKYFALLALVAAGFSFGQDGENNPSVGTYEVTITNITQGQIFSPPVVLSHGSAYNLFQLGQPSTDGVAQMAEDGMTQPLIDEALATGKVFDAVAADGPVLPGQSRTVTVTANGKYNRLSVAGMLVITNDAFFAVRNIKVRPLAFKNAGSRTQTHRAEAYDAGSEANTESCSDIPGPPCGNPGVRVTDGAEGFVYISPGINGSGDVDASTYDWRSVVAQVTVRRVN